MKRILIGILTFLGIFAAIPVLAYAATGLFQFQPIVSLPLPGGGSFNGTTSLCTYINAIFDLAITGAVILAVIMIVIDGFKYMTSEAVGNKKDALGGIRSALGGLILILASYLILYIINPQILSLSVLSPTGGALGGGCGASLGGGTNYGSGNTLQGITPEQLSPVPFNGNDLINTVPTINTDTSAGNSAEWCWSGTSGNVCYPANAGGEAACEADKQRETQPCVSQGGTGTQSTTNGSSGTPQNTTDTGKSTDNSNSGSPQNGNSPAPVASGVGSSGAACTEDSDCGFGLFCSANSTCLANGNTPQSQVITVIAGREYVNFDTTRSPQFSQSNYVTPPSTVSKIPTPTPATQGITPSEIKTIYHLPQTGGQGTIAIIDPYNDPTAEQDLDLFSTTFDLPACTTANGCFENYSFSSTTASETDGWGTEIAMDVEWAHAIAPTAKILLVSAADPSGASMLRAVDYAAERPDVVSVSMSFGATEDATTQAYDSHFTSPYGALFFAASGDNGNGVQWPAAAPNVIGVGGTTFNLASDGTFLNEIAWSGSGGGVSAYEPEPSYQSEYGIVGSNGMRGVPDVAYYAGAATSSGYAMVYNGLWYTFQGTSAGTPQWAAIAALNAGLTVQKLYADATANDSNYFNSITSGENGTCGVICSAGAGYNYITGLGSPRTATF